jgi:hypothetical protein
MHFVAQWLVMEDADATDIGSFRFSTGVAAPKHVKTLHPKHLELSQLVDLGSTS